MAWLEREGEEPNHAWPLTKVAKDGTFGSSSLRTQTEGSINLTFELTPDQPLAIARKVRVQSYHVGCVVRVVSALFEFFKIDWPQDFLTFTFPGDRFVRTYS